MPDPDETPAEIKREVRADTRDVRADARDDRAGARDTRADVRDVAAEARDERADTRETTAGEREVVTEAKEDRVLRLLRYFLFLAFILTVLSVGNFARSFINQNATEKAVNAAKDAKVAAARVEVSVNEIQVITQSTLDDLRAAVAAGAEGSAESQEAIKAIARIEHKLCGGKCPEP